MTPALKKPGLDETSPSSYRPISNVAVDLISDAVRLEQHKRIKRRTPVKHRKYETHLKRCTDKLCQGGYPSSLDFLLAVCHCTDNLTQALDNADINDDQDTEDYDVDEYLQGSSPSLSDNAPQPNSNTDNLCDNLCDILLECRES